MPLFEPSQIFVVHASLWDAMERWAADHKFHLGRLPDGADEDGVPFFKDPATDDDFTPTYAFMPKDI